MTEQPIEQFIPALVQRDAAVRKYAARLLGIEEENVPSFLLEALSSERERIRSAAALALGELGDVGAVPRLVEALDDADDATRSNAATSLGKLGDPEAVFALTRALADPSVSSRVAAATALGAFDDQQPCQA